MTDEKKPWNKPLIRKIHPTPELIELFRKKSDKVIPGELLERLARRATEPLECGSAVDRELQRKVLRELRRISDRREHPGEGKHAA